MALNALTLPEPIGTDEFITSTFSLNFLIKSVRVIFGNLERIRAANPDTWGAAIDVPLFIENSSDLNLHDRMFFPGAATVTKLP